MLRLKELRLERKLKQIDLCRMLKVSQGALSSWETGRYEIDNDNIKKLCEIFDVTADYLLGLSPDRNGYKIPNDLVNKKFAFNGFDLHGLTAQNIEDLRIVADMMRKKNQKDNLPDE